jgi:hypothetical protein
MVRKPVFLFLLVCFLSGCQSDTHKPGDSTERRMSSDIRALELTATVSDYSVQRGDTLRIHLTVRNTGKGPVRVVFPSSCKETFWVYDDEGHNFAPGEICLAYGSVLSMGHRETREYELEWRTCYGILPGEYQLVVGFHPLIHDTPHTAHPIPVEVLHRDENVAGSWNGACFDHWGIPGWVDYRISLDVSQVNSTVSGTLRAGGPEFEIHAGSIQDTWLAFEIRLANEDLKIEFTGDVCGDGIEGMRLLKRLSTGELLDTQYWYVFRTK